MDKKELIKGLKQIARGVANGYGLSITPQCQDLIDDMIRNGIEGIGSNISRVKVAQAQQDINLIISEMARLAIDDGAQILGENFYVLTKKGFCPMPPWFPPPC